MTAVFSRAARTHSLVLTLLTLPLLLGQGCPLGGTQLTVDAGNDRNVQVSLSVVLPATVSGGSAPYTYSWSPATGLSDPAVLQPTFTAATLGPVTYTLTVTDGRGATDSDAITLNVVAQSGGDGDGSGTALSVSAGPDKTTTVGAPVVLEGSATGGTAPYTYAWTPSTGLSDAAIAQPSYTPGVHGTVTLTLTVTDAANATVSDTVVVTINQTATLTSLVWGANYAGGGYQVLAGFARDLDQASAENVTNYRISGTTDQPTSAVLGADRRTVSLIFGQRLSSIARLDLGVGGTLRDALGGAVQEETNQAIGANPADTVSPTTAVRTWGADQAQYTALVQFSEAMDRASAESISHYALAGVAPATATLDATGMVVTLTFADTLVGFRRTDLLQISSGVRDINGLATTSTNPAGMIANPADATGPSAPASARVWAVNQASYALSVTFNEVLDKSSAETPAHYVLGGNRATAAALDSTGRTVTLTFGQTAAGLALADTLAISGDVLDVNGRPNVSTASTPVTANPIDTAGPSLTSELGRVWAPNAASYTVLLNFSEVIDRTSATTLANYTLAGNAGADPRHPATAALNPTGRVVTLTFPATASGLNRSDLITVSPAVRDINGQALTSTLSAPIASAPADTMPPIATSRVWKPDGTTYQLDITFSEVMDRLTAANLMNYRIHGAGGTDIERPTAAVLDATGTLVTLTFATSVGGFNRVDAVEIMPAVLDINGRSTSSITTVGATPTPSPSDAVGPAVIRATQTEAGLVDIVFSEVLDKASAQAAAYTITGGVTVDSATLRADGRTVRLAVSGGDPVGATVTVPSTVLDVNNHPAAQTDEIIADLLAVDLGNDVPTTVGQTVTFLPQVTGGLAPFTYSWTPAASLVGPTTEQPTFTPTITGSFTFTVVVTDSEGRTATDSIAVIVNPG